VKLGLIARADNTGLGIQSWEFARHMAPERTLVIDVGHLADSGLHCNKATHAERYPGAIMSTGWIPPRPLLIEFLRGLDAVFVCETPYNYELFSLAKRLGVHAVLQYNWEFLDYARRRDLPIPALFAAPSTWHYGDLRYANKILLPVPIATDRFTPREHGPTATHFLHIVGRPAIHDRNGTDALLAALEHVTAEVTVTLKCQEPGHLKALTANVRAPGNVALSLDYSPVADYWDNYTTGDVLVMPRRFGGLCLPVQEAIGAGMPAIMPAITPNHDWLPASWLVPAHRQGQFTGRSPIELYGVHPRELAAKLDRFATDPDFYAAAIAEAAEIAASHSWAALKPEYDRAIMPR
jgi:glycosyltransferase involved in cell wall biosynthesis